MLISSAHAGYAGPDLDYLIASEATPEVPAGRIARRLARTERKLERARSRSQRARLFVTMGDLVHLESRLALIESLEAWSGDVDSLDTSAADALLEQAIDWYSRAVELKPSESIATKAWTGTGTVLLELGREREGIDVLRERVHTDPVAALALGDAWFERGDCIAAREAYAAARRAPPRQASYAVYKDGWCAFRMGEVDDAVDSLLALSVDARDQGWDLLADEARDDALRMSVTLETERAVELAEGICRNRDTLCIERNRGRLAAALRAAGRIDDARVVLP